MSERGLKMKKSKMILAVLLILLAAGPFPPSEYSRNTKFVFAGAL